MARVDGSLARALDFGAAGVPGDGGRGISAGRLRLEPSMRLAGPGKYKVLEARRRRAQLHARHLLDLMDAQEKGR